MLEKFKQYEIENVEVILGGSTFGANRDTNNGLKNNFIYTIAS